MERGVTDRTVGEHVSLEGGRSDGGDGYEGVQRVVLGGGHGLAWQSIQQGSSRLVWVARSGGVWRGDEVEEEGSFVLLKNGFHRVVRRMVQLVEMRLNADDIWGGGGGGGRSTARGRVSGWDEGVAGGGEGGGGGGGVWEGGDTAVEGRSSRQSSGGWAWGGGRCH